MKVFLTPREGIGLGIQRVARALAQHAPADVEIVASREAADLEVLHVIGRGCVPPTPDFDRPIAMIQYCLRTSETPTPEAWVPYWRAARLVWSYYDLDAFVADHRRQWASTSYPALNFLVQPLGVDPVFAAVGAGADRAEQFAVGTSGFLAGDESVDAVAAACAARGLAQFHLGPQLALPGTVTYALGISDVCLARRWQECRYVSGLRRIEGFELPALEALVAGTRPICFDAPHYTRWFGEHAEYIPETGDTGAIADAIGAVLDQPVRPVTHAERTAVAARFDWPTLAETFWERLRDA